MDKIPSAVPKNLEKSSRSFESVLKKIFNQGNVFCDDCMSFLTKQIDIDLFMDNNNNNKENFEKKKNKENDKESNLEKKIDKILQSLGSIGKDSLSYGIQLERQLMGDKIKELTEENEALSQNNILLIKLLKKSFKKFEEIKESNKTLNHELKRNIISETKSNNLEKSYFLEKRKNEQLLAKINNSKKIFLELNQFRDEGETKMVKEIERLRYENLDLRNMINSFKEFNEEVNWENLEKSKDLKNAEKYFGRIFIYIFFR